jgi:hypothetical protein
VPVLRSAGLRSTSGAVHSKSEVNKYRRNATFSRNKKENTYFLVVSLPFVEKPYFEPNSVPATAPSLLLKLKLAILLDLTSSNLVDR